MFCSDYTDICEKFTIGFSGISLVSIFLPNSRISKVLSPDNSDNPGRDGSHLLAPQQSATQLAFDFDQHNSCLCLLVECSAGLMVVSI